MKIEKQDSKFIFYNNYIDSKGYEQAVCISLTINYRTRSYSITPNTSCSREFSFIETSHKWQMWKAIIKTIDEAIDFANKEIEEKT